MNESGNGARVKKHKQAPEFVNPEFPNAKT